MSNQFIRRVPSSAPISHNTREYSLKSEIESFTTVHHETLAIPDGMISAVKQNPRLEEYLDRNVIEEILHNLEPRLTIPRKSEADGKKGILGTGEQGRALPLIYGQFEYGVEGNKVSAGFGSEKGPLPTGYFYQDKSDFAVQLKNSDDISTGFTDSFDAAWDMKVENELLQYGIRSCMTFATYELDPDMLIQFIQEHWSSMGSDVVDQLLESVRKITRRGFVPAIQVRLGGTYDRLMSLYDVSEYDEFSIKRIKSMLKKGQKQFLADLKKNKADQSMISAVEKFVDAVEQKGMLNKQESTDYINAITRFFLDQAKKIEKLIEEKPEYSALALHFLQTKDIDYAFVLYDFDVTQPDVLEFYQGENYKKRLFQSIKLFVDEWRTSMIELHLISADISQSDTVIGNIVP